MRSRPCSGFCARSLRREQQHRVVDVERKAETLVLRTRVGVEAVDDGDEIVPLEFSGQYGALELTCTKSKRLAKFVSREVFPGVVHGN